MPAQILYIEDDDSQRRDLAAALRSRNFKVNTAQSGRDGIQQLKKCLPDAILCDLNMPEMNGIEVLQQVQKIAPHVPLILLTAHGTVPTAVQAMNQGAYDFILKPLQIDEIGSTLQNALEQTSLKNEVARIEARYRTLVENIPDIVYSLNPAGEFLSLNSAVTPILGYQISELIGTSFFELVHPEDRERVREGFTRAINSGIEQIRTVGFRMISKAGEAKHFEIRGRTVSEQDQIIVRNEGIAQDVSQRIALEEELKRHSEELEQRVARRTESLTFANRQLAALNDVSNIFSKIMKEAELLEKIPALITEKLEFDRATLFLERDSRELVLHSYSCEKDPPEVVERLNHCLNTREIEMPTPFRRSLDENTTIFLPGSRAASVWPQEIEAVLQNKAMVISPIRVQNHPIGIIVGSMQFHQREMDDQDVARFEMFANMVSLTLDNIRAYQSLEQKVIEKTQSLRNAYQELDEKANELEKKTYLLANANVELLSVQEELEEKNARTKDLLAAQEKSREQLQAILDSTPNVIVMVSAENQVVAVNRGIEQFFEIPLEQVIRHDFSVFLDKLRPCFENYDELLQKMEKVQIVLPDVRKRDIDTADLFKLGVQQTFPQPRTIVPICIPVTNPAKENLGKIWIFNDVTNFKRQHEQLRIIVNASPIPLIVSRLSDGKILFVNEHFANLLGYPLDELKNQITPNFYESPETREAFLQRLVQAGHLHNYETRLVRKDGTAVWVVLSVELTEINNDQVAISGLYDIDERKQAEVALKRERNFIAAVLDTTSALMLVLDANGKIVRFNRACEQATGYPFHEVVGRPFRDLFLLPEDYPRVQETMKQILAGNFPIKLENYWRTKSGERLLISWSNTALLDAENRVEYIISTGIDITEARRVEEALQNSEQNYRELVQNSNSIILRWNREGRITFFNEYAQSFFGYSEAEILGKNVVDSIVPESDSQGQNLVELMDEIESNPEKYLSNENENIKRNGERVWITWANKPIFDEAGNLREILSIGKDITESRRTAEELRRIHKIYREAIVNIEGVPYRINYAKQVYEFIGETVKILLGIPRKELTFEKIKEITREVVVTDPKAPSDPREYARAFRRGEFDHFRVDLRIQTRSGEEKWVNDSAIPVQDPQTGEVIGSLGILQDITERKRVEERLRLYRKVFTNSQDGIMIFDAEGHFIERNAAHRQLFGFSDADLRGKKSDEIFGESATNQIVEQLSKASFFRGEIEMPKGTGGFGSVDLSIFPIRNESGEVTLFVGIGRDITERKQAEAVIANRLRYEEGLAACSQTLLSNVEPEIALPRALGHLQEASAANRVSVFENFQTKTEGLCTRITFEACDADTPSQLANPQLAKIVFKDGLENWQAELSQGNAVSGVREAFAPAESAFLESQKVLSTLILPLWVEGHWHGMVVFENVSSRRNWNEEDMRLLQTAAEIISAYFERRKVLDDLAATNRTLHETQSQLVQSEKMASLGNLVAGIAHEINTPVGAINSMHGTSNRAMQKLRQILEQEFQMAFETNPQIQKMLRIIEDAHQVISSGTERVTSIVRRLRSFARLDEAELKTADIHEGLEDTLTLIHHEIKHNIQLQKDYGNLPPVACFPGQLNQVFLNILMNARQAIKGSGTISIKTFEAAGKIHVAISDTGVGIQPENLKKIFDPGFTTKGVGIGTGLGLSICYKIMQAHRGEIQVTSKIGKGTTFTVIFPKNLDKLVEHT